MGAPLLVLLKPHNVEQLPIKTFVELVAVAGKRLFEQVRGRKELKKRNQLFLLVAAQLFLFQQRTITADINLCRFYSNIKVGQKI